MKEDYRGMREAKAEAEGKTLGEKFKELGYSPQSKGKGRGRGGGNKANVVDTSVECQEGTYVERMRKGLVAPPPGGCCGCSQSGT